MRYSHRDTLAKTDLKKGTAQSSHCLTGREKSYSGINSATAEDWNRLREECPALEPLAKTGLEAWDQPADNIEENVFKPSHYVHEDGIECIDVMTMLYGEQRVREWAEITSFKYQWRQGNKANNSADQDKMKSIWYTRFSMGDDPRND